MSDSSWREELARNVRVEQIVVGALVAGAVTFLVVAAELDWIENQLQLMEQERTFDAK